MNFERPEQTESEQEKIIRVGEKEIRVGDPVTVVRSDGMIESDWRLKSFGTGVAVVEKIDVNNGKALVKPIPMHEFLVEQIPKDVKAEEFEKKKEKERGEKLEKRTKDIAMIIARERVRGVNAPTILAEINHSYGITAMDYATTSEEAREIAAGDLPFKLEKYPGGLRIVWSTGGSDIRFSQNLNGKEPADAVARVVVKLYDRAIESMEKRRATSPEEFARGAGRKTGGKTRAQLEAENLEAIRKATGA